MKKKKTVSCHNHFVKFVVSQMHNAESLFGSLLLQLPAAEITACLIEL